MFGFESPPISLDHISEYLSRMFRSVADSFRVNAEEHTYMIWAERNGTLTTGWQLSFGNGSTAATIGVVVCHDTYLDGMGVIITGTGTYSATAQIAVDGVANASYAITGTNTAPQGTVLFRDPLFIPAGSRVSFYVSAVSGTVSGPHLVTAALRRRAT